MSAVSALTTALTDDGRPREPQGLSSIAENSIPSTISSSAFPCLSEGGPSGDAFEVELDLKKLTLGEKDDRWGKRRSLDRRSLDRRSLDRRSIGRRSLDRSSFDEPQVAQVWTSALGGYLLSCTSLTATPMADFAVVHPPAMHHMMQPILRKEYHFRTSM